MKEQPEPQWGGGRKLRHGGLMVQKTIRKKPSTVWEKEISLKRATSVGYPRVHMLNFSTDNRRETFF